MSKGGRGGGEPPWEGVLDEIRNALREADIEDGGVQDALIEGLRHAFSELDEGAFAADDEGANDGVTRLPGRPEVTVVEGGRAEDDTDPPSGNRPDLRVAHREPSLEEPEEEDDEDDEDDDSDDGMGGRRVVAHIRVLRGGGSRPLLGGGQAASEERPGARPMEGQIGVAAGEAQAVFRGASPHCYRIHCDKGSIDIVADELHIHRLRAAQSLDVEGRDLRVEGAGSGDSVGRYHRIGEAG